MDGEARELYTVDVLIGLGLWTPPCNERKTWPQVELVAKRQTSRAKLRQEGVVEPLYSLLHFVEASYQPCG